MPPRRKKDDHYKSAEEIAEEKQIAKEIRNQENAAAAGKPAWGTPDGKPAWGTPPKDRSGIQDSVDDDEDNDTRTALQGQEASSGFYRPEGGGQKRSLGQIGGVIKSGLRKQRNLWAIGIISSIIGGGWMFVLLAIMSGPLQFIHMGKSMEQFHLTIQEAQTGALALKLSRNIYHVTQGNRQKTNMGYLGNRYADRIQRNLETKGFVADFSGGFFRGFVIDPKTIDTTNYPGMRDDSPEAVRDYYRDRYNVANARIEGGKVRLPNTGSYLTDTRMMYSTMRSAKMGALAPLKMHVLKKRVGFTLNPFSYWITNQILEGAERRYNEWKKQRETYVRKGVQVPNGTFTSRTDQEGNATNANDTDEAARFNDEVKDVANSDDPSKLNNFRTGLTAKLTGITTAAIGVLCFAKAIAAQYDIITQENVVKPLERISMSLVSAGSANEHGGDKVVDAEQNGFLAQSLCDDTGCWSDAAEVQSFYGRSVSGPEISGDAKVGPNGNFLTKFLENIPGLDTACSPVGQAALIVVGTIIAGPISTAISAVVGILTGPLLEKFIGWIMNTFLGRQVEANPTGETNGSYGWYGTMFAANDDALGVGGAILTEAESAALREANQSYLAQEFQQQSLAYRLFDPNDPRSFMAQVIDKQRPDPADNLSHVATGVLGIGRNFGSTVFRLLTWKTYAAADEKYYNGWRVVGIKPAVLNSTDPTIENLFVNADMAADALDGNNAQTDSDSIDNYIHRAKVCFERDIIKRPFVDEDGQSYELYTVAPPEADRMSTYQEAAKPGNKCDEGNDEFSNGTIHDWLRIRLFMGSDAVMNALACRIGGTEDTVAQKACADLGNAANSGASGTP
jgi:hypothetical protein